MNRTAALTGLLAASLLVTACDTGQSDADLQAASDAAHALVVGVSDDLVDALRDANPDLTFDVQGRSGEPALSWDCSDGPASDADAIQWAVNRQVEVIPPQPIDALLDPLVDTLVADDWELLTDEVDGSLRKVELTRDGFHADMAADRSVTGDDPVWVRLSTYSPCLQAPGS